MEPMVDLEPGIAEEPDSLTSFNPLNTDKLRINATFRQQMAFFGHFGPSLVPILEKSAF